MCYVFHLACVSTAYSLSGDQYLQYLEDMLTLLGGLEEMFQHNYGTQSAACRLVCDVQCHVIREVLEHFQSTSKAMDSSLSAGPRSGTIQRSISYSGISYVLTIFLKLCLATICLPFNILLETNSI